MMKLPIHFFLGVLALLTVACAVDCNAQDDTVSKIGAYGDLSLNRHTADFRALPGVPNCCPQFESGSGTGFTAGILYELSLAARVGLQMRLGYTSHDAKLSRTENTLVSVNNAAVPGAFEHTINASLGSVGLEPSLRVGLWKGLSIFGGARFAMMITLWYSQSEQIVDPSDRGVFLLEGTRTRNESDGDIPQSEKLYIALHIGASYALPLNARGSLRLVPEVSYSHGFTPLVTGYKWYASAIRIGASLQYAFIPTADTPFVYNPPSYPNAPKPPPDTIVANVDVAELLPDGTERPVTEIVVEQFRSRHLRPLLNYVFFDENSSTMPMRYTRLRNPDTFMMDSLVNVGTMETYHHLLNIIGWRLRKRPSARVTLTGCNANIRGELGNKALSKSRADDVARYLTDVWKIDKSRIDIVARDLPSVPSGSRTEDGIAENMRVEIACDVEEILDPVITDDTLQLLAPSKLRFRPTVSATAGIRNVVFDVNANGRSLYTSTGSSVDSEIDVDANDLTTTELIAGVSLRADLAATDTRDKRATASTSVPLRLVTLAEKFRVRREDVSKDRYSMILFDYAQSGLSRANKKIMDDVKKRVTSRSKVEVVGHTDRIGTDESNLRLSTRRAEETGAYIAAPSTKSYGVGRKYLLYNNDLPEGRFYCRTVEINVETVVSSQ